jgi:gamma-butyrobetaine dioxygenase
MSLRAVRALVSEVSVATGHYANKRPKRAIRVLWGDGHESTFPFVFLRDICQTGFHPSTNQREFLTYEIPVDSISVASPPSVTPSGDVCVEWNDGHRSLFAPSWLREHCLEEAERSTKQSLPYPQPWEADSLSTVADLEDISFSCHSLIGNSADDAQLHAFLTQLLVKGFAIVTDAGTEPGSVEALCACMGFIRRTNYGTTYEVQSKPNPNNQAYTTNALPLHTDLPFYDYQPGIQMIHCLQASGRAVAGNTGSNGESWFSDGLAVAQHIQNEFPVRVYV